MSVMHSEMYQKDQKYKSATSTGTAEVFNDYLKSSRCVAMVETYCYIHATEYCY